MLSLIVAGGMKPGSGSEKLSIITSIYIYLGVKEMADPSDGIYMDAYSAEKLGGTVYRMIANISAVQKFGGLVEALAKARRSRNAN